MIAAVVLTLMGLPALQKEKEPDRIGRVFIEGNTDTPDTVILHQVFLFPGQILPYPRLAEARARLARMGLFDPAEPPTVEVLPNEFKSEFKDIRIRVRERPWNWAIFTTYDVFTAVLQLDAEGLLHAAARVWWKLRDS